MPRTVAIRKENSFTSQINGKHFGKHFRPLPTALKDTSPEKVDLQRRRLNSPPKLPNNTFPGRKRFGRFLFGSRPRQVGPPNNPSRKPCGVGRGECHDRPKALVRPTGGRRMPVVHLMDHTAITRRHGRRCIATNVATGWRPLLLVARSYQ